MKYLIQYEPGPATTSYARASTITMRVRAVCQREGVPCETRILSDGLIEVEVDLDPVVFAVSLLKLPTEYNTVVKPL